MSQDKTQHNEMIGMQVSFYANQAIRDAVVIAAVGNQALTEYEMPSGVLFLRILAIDEHGQIDEDSGRSVSYKAIPQKFIEHMRANRAHVSRIFLGGFDRSVAPSSKAWQRAHNDRMAERAAAVKLSILGEATAS